MAFNTKRKFDDAEELAHDAYVPVKHTKVAPIAEPVVTEDVDMGSDDAPSPAPSLASLATTASSHNSPAYPHFDLYPFPTSGDADMMDSNPAFDPRKQARSDSTVGLMQPQTAANDFIHHGANCSQIPRLRIASHPGLDGRRSLWSHCIECGAVEMVPSP